MDPMSHEANPAAPPAHHLFLLEARSVVELVSTLWMTPLLRLAPAGDGHPVLVLPGLAAGDASTWVLRSYLMDRGYRVHGWKLGCAAPRFSSTLI